MKKTNSILIWTLALLLILPVLTIMPTTIALANGVEISAVCSPESMASGGTVEIEVTVTNETDMELEDVGISYGGYNTKIGNIAPGDSTYDEGSINLSDSQLGVPITVNVTYTTGGLAGTRQTTVTVRKEQSSSPPSVNFSRSANTKQAAPGDKVTLTYEVKNNSSESISNVAISDPAAAGVASGDSIAAGQSKKYTATVTANSDIKSSPKLSYTYAGKNYDKTLDTLTVAVAKASLSISATADKTNVNKGDSVSFQIRLNNTGSTNINNIKLVDDKGEVIRSSASVNAGASPSVTHSIVFEETRSVVFTASYPSGNETATATSDPIEIKVEGSEVAGEGKLSIVSVATDPAEPEIPGAVTLLVTVRNDGAVTLTNVQVNEARLGRVGTVSELLPGASKEVSKKTNLTEAAEFVVSATASDDGGNTYDAGTKSLSVAGIAASPDTTPTGSPLPSATPKPAGDGLRTMIIAMIVIVVLIVITGIVLIVLMVKERKAKRLAEEEDEDIDEDDSQPLDKDNPQQVEGARPPRRRPEGEQPRRRPEGGQPPRRPDEQPRRRPEGEHAQRRRPPKDELEQTRVIPPQYQSCISEDTQEIPTASSRHDDYYRDDRIEERPRRQRRPDEYDYYEEERPSRRREQDDYYEDVYREERPRRRRPPEGQQPAQQQPQQPRKRKPTTEDDLNYGPPKRRRKRRDDE